MENVDGNTLTDIQKKVKRQRAIIVALSGMIVLFSLLYVLN